MGDAPARIKEAARLENLGRDLRNLLGPARPLLRPRLTRQVVAALASGQSVLLSGQPGVGKTELARSLPREDWPAKGEGQLRLADERSSPDAPAIIETCAARFMDGCYYVGHLENKMRILLDDAHSRRAVLFIDSIEECLGAGAGSEDPDGTVANLLLPYVERGLRIVGATTPQGAARLRFRHPRLHSHLLTIDVPEPDAEETREIARHHLKRIATGGASVGEGALEEGLAIVERHMAGEVAVAAFLRLARRAASATGAVSSTSLRKALAEELGVRPGFVGVGRPPTYGQLHALLSSAVFGQEEAVTEVSDALLRFTTGLNGPSGPIASLLFVGPSGCGKTSLALAAADVLSRDPDAVLRFDMSEFADPGAVERLLAESEGSLVGRLEQRPCGVLLLDEIEKAHPSVIRLLLQALGESRITSRGGALVRLDNHLVVMTSNAGSRRWSSRHPDETVRRLVLGDCAEEFPPEFLARCTSIVLFRPLDEQAARMIVERELERLNELPGVAERGLQLLWTDLLLDRLVACGVNPVSGARAVEAAVRRLVVSPLARWLADNASLCCGPVMLAPRIREGELESLSIEWGGEREPGLLLN